MLDAFTKRFDGYAGAMYSAVYDGVANGYTQQRNNINPTIGVHFKFRSSTPSWPSKAARAFSFDG